jgi:ABC-2 type transport system ATP-binding protein
MTALLVETTDLTKRYGPRAAVDHVGLRVRRGEVYGFLGPNGAGKTTTLRMLLGLVRPTSGTVRVLGAPPGDRAAAYSLGMQQRLGLAAALLKDAELLILDEPTNGLDPAGVAEMRLLLRRLGSGGRTVLLSSHLLGEVQQVCDRIGVLSGGRLLREGTVAELRGHGALLVTAQPLEQARIVAQRLLGPDRVAVQDGALRLQAEPDQAARVNRELVTAGVAVSALGWAERTLEDVFLELTNQPTSGDGRG